MTVRTSVHRTHPGSLPAALTAAALPPGYRSAGQVATANVVAREARVLGVSPRIAVADAIVESGLNPRAVGDQGTSFGLFQLHQGGELGALTKAQAFTPLTNARVALSEFRTVQRSTPSLLRNPGALAATAQRPQLLTAAGAPTASPAASAYAAKVNRVYGELGRVPATGPRATVRTSKSTGSGGINILPFIELNPFLAFGPGGAVTGKVVAHSAISAAQKAGQVAGAASAATVIGATTAADAAAKGILDSQLKPWAKAHFFELVTGAIVAGILLEGHKGGKGITLSLPSGGSGSTATESEAADATPAETGAPAAAAAPSVPAPSPASDPDAGPRAATVSALRTMGYSAPQARTAVDASWQSGMGTEAGTAAALQALDRPPRAARPKAPARAEPAAPLPSEADRPEPEVLGRGPVRLPEDLGPPRRSRETRRSRTRRSSPREAAEQAQHDQAERELADYRQREMTALRQAVLAHGGIRTSSASRDYDADRLPFYLRRRRGQPLDALAQEMGYGSADHLVRALNGEDGDLGAAA